MEGVSGNSEHPIRISRVCDLRPLGFRFSRPLRVSDSAVLASDLCVDRNQVAFLAGRFLLEPSTLSKPESSLNPKP